jgi:hypothetical protein
VGRQARIVAGKEQDMTREDILKLARVIGLHSAVLLHIYGGREGALTDQELAELQRLERFFRLAYECGAAAEREACVKVCEDKAKETFSGQCQVWGDYFTAAIRARGNK